MISKRQMGNPLRTLALLATYPLSWQSEEEGVKKFYYSTSKATVGILAMTGQMHKPALVLPFLPALNWTGTL